MSVQVPIVGKSYWHKRCGIKVWVTSYDPYGVPGVYITKSVEGYTYIVYPGELEEIEEDV